MSNKSTSSSVTVTKSESIDEKPYFDKNQRMEFQEFLQSLANKTEINENDYLKLESIYSKKLFKQIYHHYYNDIGGVLSQQNIEQLDSISTNLQFIKTNYVKQKIDIKYQLEKLYDHSNIRILEQRMYNQIQSKTECSIESLSSKAKEIEKKLEKNKFDYITILGIFASIVLAFVGGLTFSTSVLNNINSVSIYRLVFVAGIIGLVFFNIIFTLLQFVSTVKGIKAWITFIVFNSIFCFILILTPIIFHVNNKIPEPVPIVTNVYEQFQDEK